MTLLALIIFSAKSIGENNSQAASDQAVIEKMVTETNSFTQRIRCIEDQTWMLTSPEAREAEVQQRLAAAGLPSERIDPAVLRRLEAAKACPEPGTNPGSVR